MIALALIFFISMRTFRHLWKEEEKLRKSLEARHRREIQAIRRSQARPRLTHRRSPFPRVNEFGELED